MNVLAAQTLLDPERVLEAVRDVVPGTQHLDTLPVIEAMWVKPGRYFNVAYGWPGDAERATPLRLSAFALDPTQTRRAVRTVAHVCDGGDSPDCPGCATFVGADDTLWQLFPHDYRLPALATCMRPDAVRHLFNDGHCAIRAERVGYRPGMRALIRYHTDHDGMVYGKLAHEREPRQYIEPLDRASTAARRRPSHLRLPRVLAYDGRLGLGLIEALHGEELYERLGRAAPMESALTRTAEALASLHSLAIDGVQRTYEAQQEIDLLRPWIEVVESVVKPFTGARLAILQQLEAALPPTRPHRTPVHRDFYDKQILLADDHVAVLDLDTLAFGDVEIDLGNFAAHLFLRGAQWARPTAARAHEEMFLAAYPNPAEESRVRWYRRTTLLRLSCVYALRPGNTDLVAALLAEARTS